MATYSGWNNARIMANQGKAPKVAQIYNDIINDPFSSCFFLCSLYEAKEKALRESNPAFFSQTSHEVARIRVELVLVDMYLHIKGVQKKGLQSMLDDKE